MTTEARLAEYRTRKLRDNPNYMEASQRKESLPDKKSLLEQTVGESAGADDPPPVTDGAAPVDGRGEHGVRQRVASLLARVPFLQHVRLDAPERLWTWQVGLTATLWLIFWGLFIELEFGAVYFLISGFVFMYRCTRTRPRQEGEASAYSVFNPGCERIDGTFTSEQFERQLGLGLANPH